MITFEWRVYPAQSSIVGNACACGESNCYRDHIQPIIDQAQYSEFAWCDIVVTGTVGAETRTASLGGCTFADQQAFIDSDEYLSMRQEIEQEFIDAGIVTGIQVVKMRNMNQWHTRWKQETLHDGIYATEQEAWKRAYNALDDNDKMTLFMERLIAWCDNDDNISDWAAHSTFADFCIIMGPDALHFYDCHERAIWLMLQDAVGNDTEYTNIPDYISKVTDSSNPLSDQDYVNIAYVWAAVNYGLYIISNQWCEDCNKHHSAGNCE